MNLLTLDHENKKLIMIFTCIAVVALIITDIAMT